MLLAPALYRTEPGRFVLQLLHAKQFGIDRGGFPIALPNTFARRPYVLHLPAVLPDGDALHTPSVLPPVLQQRHGTQPHQGPMVIQSAGRHDSQSSQDDRLPVDRRLPPNR